MHEQCILGGFIFDKLSMTYFVGVKVRRRGKSEYGNHGLHL